MLGPDQPVVLHLLDLERAAKPLSGVAMELVDAHFPLLRGVVATSDLNEACKDVDYAVLVGGFPRGPGMERADLMAKNAPIFGPQGRALAAHASADVKVLVVANPANTNAWIVSQAVTEDGKRVKAENVTAMTRLDHNRASGQVALRAGCAPGDVKGVVVWGNHSSTQYPDVNHCTVGGKPAREACGAGASEWFDGAFVPLIQQRGKAVIEARGASSALSAARSACDHVLSWARGTGEGGPVSMAVPSDGSYGIPEGIVYSFPCVCPGDGTWRIAQGLPIDDRSRALMDATARELQEEQAEAKTALGE